MNDKTRAEFEKEFPIPSKCWWSEKSNSYCWTYFGVTRHPHDELWQVWLAAKEKYEPKSYLLDDRSLLMRLSVMDGDRIKTITKLIPVIEAEHSEAKVIEWQAVQCWHELTAPSTQGEEK